MMGDESTDSNKRKSKWSILYGEMTIPEAKKRLGVKLTLCAITVKKMVEGKSALLGKDSISKIKKKVYDNLVRYLEIEGYPSEANPDFKEANITDLVLFAIYPILRCFKHDTV
ncbi:hypothetical protein L211DRAFT_879953 [Terfezia boudieri ATCC MYA-4762]|uniref:Uncharacterized protein n=1 Tax=Terfezia boudieri ATCC MYA-4762 TaxID=1051890 RepID=A0A3N4LQ94_9PEZI|nr:hypothetical protein L211DRAFT_879953 [Terfezia boudieri ATCC MYA-4762]